MNDQFYTFQDFYTYTEGVTYILIIVALIFSLCFWKFLAGKDHDDNGNES